MSKVRAIKSPESDEEQTPHLALVDQDTVEAAEDTGATPADMPAPTLPIDMVVYLDSLGVSMLDRFSLVRVFRKQWRSKVAFLRSEDGGSLTLEEAVKQATH